MIDDLESVTYTDRCLDAKLVHPDIAYLYYSPFSLKHGYTDIASHRGEAEPRQPTYL